MADIDGLNDHIYTIVYKTIVATMKANPTLRRLFGDRWMTYTGENANRAPLAGQANGPTIEVMPFGMAASPEATTLQNSPFGLTITITSPGLNVCNVMNVWGAVHDALFVGDGETTLRMKCNTAIQAAVAIRTGRPLGSFISLTLGSPAIKHEGEPSSQLWRASGSATVELVVSR